MRAASRARASGSRVPLCLLHEADVYRAGAAIPAFANVESNALVALQGFDADQAVFVNKYVAGAVIGRDKSESVRKRQRCPLRFLLRS